MLFVEALHDDDRPAISDRSADAGQRRGVVERRRRQVDLTLAKSQHPRKRGEDGQRLRRRVIGERTQHALRPSRRAGGIQHRRADCLVRDRSVWEFSRRVLEIPHMAPFAGTLCDQAELDIRTIGQGRERGFALRLRRDEHLRKTVVDDIGDFVWRQKRIDAGEIEPGALARGAAFDKARLIFHEDCIVVARLRPTARKRCVNRLLRASSSR